MSVEAVREYFNGKTVDVEIFELPTSGATVEEAADTIGVPAAMIAKTLALHLNDGVIIIVMGGSSRIDNKKYKQAFGAKAKMLAFEEVEELTGHPVGGLCPFGLKADYPVYLDKSIEQLDYVYPAAGSRFAAMKIKTADMAVCTEAQWVDICKS